MAETIKQYGDLIIWFGSVIAAIGAVWALVTKPIKALGGKVDTMQGDTDLLMGDRLAQAHDHWMRKGYCPPLDKTRLVEMHARYAKRGLNHLAQSYEEDLLDLPDVPPSSRGTP